MGISIQPGLLLVGDGSVNLISLDFFTNFFSLSIKVTFAAVASLHKPLKT